jgi:hypothetical protein
VQRLVELWHRRLYTASLSPRELDRTWKPCGIAGHAQTATACGVSYEWEIVELLSTIELRDEGATMRHCVASYATRAASGSCAIFSLRRRHVGESDFVSQVTIEVDPKYRQIVQARCARNQVPSSDELRVIREWARIAQLELRDGRTL